MSDGLTSLDLPIPEDATHRYRQQNGKMTWAKNYRTDGMRFRAKLWSLGSHCWEPKTNIILSRLLPLHDD